LFVGLGVVGVRVFSSWVGRDDGLAAAFGQPIAEFPGVIGAISDEPLGCRDAPQKRRHADEVMGLASCHGESDRAASTVGYGMNFGRPSAARSADGMFEVPPFAPAADRCALTWVESTIVVLTTPLEPVSA
jgi:hypothetical protein